MLDSLNIYLKSLSVTSGLLSYVGLDIYNKNFKIHWFTIVVLFDIFTYIIANGYSAYIYRNDFEKLMFCLTTWPLGFMVNSVYSLINKLCYRILFCRVLDT